MKGSRKKASILKCLTIVGLFKNRHLFVFKNTEKQSQYLRSFPFPISLLVMVYLLTPFTKHQQASSSETSFA